MPLPALPGPARLALVACLLVMLQGLGCAARQAPEPEAPPAVAAIAPFEGFDWPADERVRSAGWLRASGLGDDLRLDPGVERTSLRAHFEFVTGWLAENEAASLDLAVARWQAGRGRALTGDEARVLRARLRFARARQVATLTRYAQRERFPINADSTRGARPIFVDEADTACAVGFLMRADGWEDDVAAILAERNGIYVEDAEGGALYAWVVESGLTIEEAAVIQPAYAPPTPNVDLAALSAPGATADAIGVRISNLSASHTTETLPAGADPVAFALVKDVLGLEAAIASVGGLASTTTQYGASEFAGLGLSVGTSYISPHGGMMESFYTTTPVSPYFYWSTGGLGQYFLSDPGGTNAIERFSLSYDLTVLTPSHGFDAEHFAMDVGFFGNPSHGDELMLEVLVETTGGALLAGFASTGGPGSPPFPGLAVSHEQAFGASQTVRVHVTAESAFADGATAFGAFRQDFRIVPIPEPGTATLLGLGLLALAARRRD